MSGPAPVASVVLNRPLGKALSYRIPPELEGQLAPGYLVEVPIGPRKEVGCVVEVGDSSAVDPGVRLRPLRRRVADGYTISGEILRLSQWVADYYCCSWGEALAAASVIGFSDTNLPRRMTYRIAKGWRDAGLTTRQRAVAEKLAGGAFGVLPLAELAAAAGTTTATLRRMQQAGALEEVPAELPAAPAVPPPDERLAFLPDQQTAFDAVHSSIQEGKFAVHLLHGVTGSGKTEVYLRLIEEVMGRGGTALCLVPEIALTPQTVARFASRFQQEVGVFHSQQTRREKRILHEKIVRGQIRLVIGARSATFVPLPKLGLIVIDEEHEGSYKQGESPRYHARDVSIVRAQRLGIPVVLGSATPSFESMHNARTGKYRLLELRARPAGLSLPAVRLISMAEVAMEDPKQLTLLSPDLQAAIQSRLERGEQSLLFLNRRGFSNFLLCPSCKWVARCDDDDIVLTIHRRSAKGRSVPAEPELFPGPLAAEEAYLKCHFCSRLYDYPKSCPNCGESSLAPVGSGTQRIEEALRRVYPEADILRLDQDSTGGRQGFLKAWQRMVSGEAQIILGTQMIAKGLHLERVSLVGVILADVGLFIPDFRAEERTFSLLMQVAGRAGRNSPGEVLVQTYMPHHAAVRIAAQHDYTGFYELEMKRRRRMAFPPWQRLVALTFSDEKLARAEDAARRFAGILRRVAHRTEHRGLVVMGPRPAPVERIAGRCRQRLLLRGGGTPAIVRLLRQAQADNQWRLGSTTRLAIDVDPQDLL